MSDDDDLRFGDVSGDSGGGSLGDGGIINLLLRGFVAMIILYVMLSVLETLIGVNIPLIG